jgi:putative ABC transport system ATP-binding protein
LGKTYGHGPAAVQALKGVDLDLHAGELVVLLGASGSGKSTLLNLLGGLDVPSAGSLVYRGWDLAHADEAGLTRYRRDVVGFVFQFYNLIPSLTARENVALITEIARDPMQPEEALRLVGLEARMDHFPAEPTGALDLKTGMVVLDAIERINRELGTLTAIITHNAVIADMADRVLHLSDGRIDRAHVNEKRAAVDALAW